jgi:hypothetical protein
LFKNKVTLISFMHYDTLYITLIDYQLIFFLNIFLFTSISLAQRIILEMDKRLDGDAIIV